MYEVRTSDGQVLVWEGTADAVSAGVPTQTFLVCAAGTLINVAHVVTMTPLNGQ